MIVETLKQAQEAIAEIKTLTGWTLTRISRKVGVSRICIVNLVEGRTKDPNDDTLKKLGAELERVRDIHKAEEQVS